jgi:hypothetical protein
MRARNGILFVATGVLLSSLAGTALAQGTATAQPAAPGDIKTPITVTELFSKAKPGMWVRLEGTPQPDQTVRCNRARIITGAIEDDDWAIKGQIKSVEPGTQQLTVGRYHVKLKSTSKFLPATTLHGITDLKPGMYVRVVGTYSADGGLLARKVEDQTAAAAEKADGNKRVLNQGKVERVDAAKKAIVLMGTTFVLSPETKATAVVEM